MADESSKAITKPYELTHFVDTTKPVWNYSLFSDEDISNFKKGTHYSLYKRLGSHHLTVLEKKGYYFAVWAPNATAVTVVGDFNKWNNTAHPLFVRLDKSGIWEGFIPGIGKGTSYKYHITGFQGVELDKGDPYANYWELRPGTASRTWSLDHKWKDSKWMKKRGRHNSLSSPWSVYEVHLASWMRPDKHDEETYNSYKQITERLVPYVKEMGFTHIELMPVMEYPYDGSWGYQGCGYFAATSRFGTPQDFMKMIEAFHSANIGVVLDWVPSHFPYDAHGLYMFDGTHTYEYADMRKGFHPDWNSYVFNYERPEVRDFLISSARYWFDVFHIDGIRVDAVNSILRLDYSRKEGEWEPNIFGSNGNLEAISFIKELNETVYRDFPDVQTIAEEASDWPMVSKPTSAGGLGFGMKWMMGWMHDTLDYFKADPLFRMGMQDKFSFSMMYYYDENFMLPLSHDEVVHGKSPMIYKMPGDEWQKFANLRLLYTYMFIHPGAKLLFMGNEFGQTSEWNYKSELDWPLLEHDAHNMLKTYVRDLNHLYQKEAALYELQFDPEGFEWVDLEHRSECVVSFKRKGKKKKDAIVAIFNMTPIPHPEWKIILTGKDCWKEILNSDDKDYWGTGIAKNESLHSKVINKKNKVVEVTISLPPLGAVILK